MPASTPQLGGGSAPAPGTQSFLNTSNPWYLPMAPGNTWRFDQGITLIDQGTVTDFSCNSGHPYERIAVYNNGQTTTPVGSFYFTQGSVQGSTHTEAFLVGTSTGNSDTARFCLLGSGTPSGLPLRGDNSKVGDTYSCSTCITGMVETATITAVGGTRAISGGSTMSTQKRSAPSG